MYMYKMLIVKTNDLTNNSTESLQKFETVRNSETGPFFLKQILLDVAIFTYNHPIHMVENVQ